MKKICLTKTGLATPGREETLYQKIDERTMKPSQVRKRFFTNGVERIRNIIIMGHKGHYGEYSGNAKWSRVTSSNMGATKRDDEAHMKYLKEDVDYDNKHGHSDEKMTADEKHISRLAGDLKYDEKKH